MPSGKGRWCRRWWLAGVLTALASGCAASHPQFEQALLADRTPASHDSDPTGEYRVHCPDVLEVDVGYNPALSGVRRIGADGRIDLGDGSRVRVDGLTLPGVAGALARRVGIPAHDARVRVVEFNSRQVYLIGEVTGVQRTLDYRGPETVLDLLQRAGGITPGAAVGDVQIVRPHVAEGTTPEIFHIDLEAIVLHKDQHTNIHIEPFDQVYIGQSRRSQLRPCFPPWLRPTYETLCGLRRPTAAAPALPATPPTPELAGSQGRSCDQAALSVYLPPPGF
jgi:protein involved in polysaccharide export with SLBB domain